VKLWLHSEIEHQGDLDNAREGLHKAGALVLREGEADFESESVSFQVEFGTRAELMQRLHDLDTGVCVD
jgi:hypothetical protein